MTVTIFLAGARVGLLETGWALPSDCPVSLLGREMIGRSMTGWDADSSLGLWVLAEAFGGGSAFLRAAVCEAATVKPLQSPGITIQWDPEPLSPAEALEELGNGVMVLDSAGRHPQFFCTFMLFRFKI